MKIIFKNQHIDQLQASYQCLSNVFQGLVIAQLARTVKDVTLIGVASKSKHEAIKEHFDHLLERGCDYVSEVRK